MGFVRTMEQANDEKTNYGGDGSSISIGERKAAKCGFKAERINAARVRKTTSSTLPSPTAHLTIPQESSPTALLDCPIMLPNSQALPSSPTTGTFHMPPPIGDISMPKSETNNEDVHNRASGVQLKIEDDPQYLSGYSAFENQITDYKTLVLEQHPMNFELPMEFPEELNTKNYVVDPTSNDVKSSNTAAVNENYPDLQMPSDHNSLSKETLPGEDVNETHQVLEGEYKGYPCMGMARNSDDGYNWRKYGQKQVKGSEYPRSYYKCTNPNCLVKKKVERSFDGQITEIIYKGAPHNHAQPQPNRRTSASLGSAFQFDEMSEMIEGNRTSAKAARGSVWETIQGGEDIKSGLDGLERTSSTSVVTDLSDLLSATQGKSLSIYESAETPEFSSGLVSFDDDDDDQAAQKRMDEADNEESESKRRKKESCMIESSMASRAVREPRVVVQIESEIDILDDGYRWRKYGQKVVKGNPNPRSYYKCTSAKCPVRKHVERASHDLKFVITTYEGKHNHEVPAARNSNHINSNGRTPAGNAHQPLGLSSRSSNMPKPETQDLAPHCDRKPEFYNEYLRPFYLGNFNNDLKFGVSSLYQMKIPPLHNTMPYGSYGLNSFHHNQAGSIVPDFSKPLPLNLPPPGNLGLAGGYDFNNGKSVSSQPYYLAQRQLQENNTSSFVKAKQEPKEESEYDLGLPPTIDHQGIYNRIMGGYPSYILVSCSETNIWQF